MQKVYERINWENDPSTNTPINEDNLNKMDYALDQIDNRVVNLSGYQERAPQSEKNAKTSETNAKTSETNAKQSELKAKEYMERAWEATPEGYDALVSQVEAIDIKKTTDSTLHNTKHGGLRLTKMVGNTEQKKLSGKNLVNTTATTQTINGVTFTVKDDGTIVANGTADPYAEIKLTDLFIPPNGTYKLVGCPSGGGEAKYQLTAFYNDAKSFYLTDFGSGASGEFNVDTMKNVGIYFTVRKGVTLNNLVIKPMLTKDLNATYDDFEPYLGGVELVQGMYVDGKYATSVKTI